jgi:hypothetical protein
MCKVSMSLFVCDELCLIVNKQYRIRIVKCLAVCILSRGLDFKLMPPPKSCLFSYVAIGGYPFLISDEIDVKEVRCTLWNSNLSVYHGCRNDLHKHIRTNKQNK